MAVILPHKRFDNKPIIFILSQLYFLSEHVYISIDQQYNQIALPIRFHLSQKQTGVLVSYKNFSTNLREVNQYQRMNRTKQKGKVVEDGGGGCKTWWQVIDGDLNISKTLQRREWRHIRFHKQCYFMRIDYTFIGIQATRFFIQLFKKNSQLKDEWFGS